jgi:hypothetical protein
MDVQVVQVAALVLVEALIKVLAILHLPLHHKETMVVQQLLVHQRVMAPVEAEVHLQLGKTLALAPVEMGALGRPLQLAALP